MTVNKYLAIDPGEGGKTGGTGWATFDELGNATGMGQFKTEKFVEEITALLTSELTAVIVEDYKNHGFTQQKRWSRNQTSKHIGKIEMLAEMRGVPVVLQSNTCKAMGYMYAGRPEGAPSNHAISHQYDAYAHGVFYLHSIGVREAGRGMDNES